jgi:O-antigen ligase
MLAARPVQIHVIARLFFWAIFLMSLANLSALVVTYLGRLRGERYVIGIYPVMFAVAMVIVLVFSKGRHKSPLLVAAWVYWTVFTLGGFVGQGQLTATNFRFILQVTVLPWITLIGMPWLALRAISEDKLPRLLRATVIVTCAGTVFGLLQLLIPGFMSELLATPDRASGLWLEPNSGGYLVVMVLFLSLICPFRASWVNWVIRLVFLVGVAASLSRASMLALLVGWVVYAISSKRFATLFKSVIGLAVVAAATLPALTMMEEMVPESAKRITYLRSFLTGDWSDGSVDNRTVLWKATFEAIKQGGMILGVGHGSMAGVADDLAPHNYYLLVWGNSGILALFALLAYKFTLFHQAARCTRQETRAALMAVASVLCVVHMFDGAVIGAPFISAAMACVVITVCYGKMRSGVGQRQPPLNRGLRPVFSGNPATSPGA